jgi:hypothetical protein
MSNIITFELCQEDRKRLDDLIASADIIIGEMQARRPLQMQKIDETGIYFGTAAEGHPDPVGAPGEPGEPGQPEPVEEPEQPKYTKEDVQAKVQKLAKPGNPKREQAKAIVKSYAAKVSDIPEDKFPEVMAKLAELEG